MKNNFLHPSLKEIIIFKLIKDNQEKYPLVIDGKNFSSLENLRKAIKEAEEYLSQKYPDWKLSELIIAEDLKKAGLFLKIPNWQEIKKEK